MGDTSDSAPPYSTRVQILELVGNMGSDISRYYLLATIFVIKISLLHLGQALLLIFFHISTYRTFSV